MRLFLSPYDLTPTYKNVSNRFSVKYYLNLVLVDEEDRRYFKQQEVCYYVYYVYYMFLHAYFRIHIHAHTYTDMYRHTQSCTDIDKFIHSYLINPTIHPSTLPYPYIGHVLEKRRRGECKIYIYI